MIAQLRSELLKQRTTRTTLAMLGWMVGLIVLVVVLHVVGFSAHQLAVHGNQLKVFGWGTGIGALFASLVGAISITGEIRHGTIRPTLLATPNRAVVIGAKVAASALAGLLVGLLAEALVAGLASAGLAIRGIHNTLTAMSCRCSPAVPPPPRFGHRSGPASARLSETRSAPSSDCAYGYC